MRTALLRAAGPPFGLGPAARETSRVSACALGMRLRDHIERTVRRR
jgi:hypothetical protein